MVRVAKTCVRPFLFYWLFPIVVGGVPGIYPAFYLSTFSLVSILKGGTVSSRRAWLRKGLVVERAIPVPKKAAHPWAALNPGEGLGVIQLGGIYSHDDH